MTSPLSSDASSAAGSARGSVAPRPVLLLLTTDPELRGFFSRELADAYELLFARDGDEAAVAVATRQVALAVVYDAAGGEGPFALRDRLVAVRPDMPVMLVAAQGSEDRAVQALKRGFTDYIVRRSDTLQPDLFKKRLGSNIELARLKRDNENLRQAIEESQARLFNIYDSLDDVIMQIDGQCRVVSLNRSAAALANCEPKEAVGKVCFELFDFYPCQARALKESCHIYRTFIEGETIRGEREDVKAKRVHQYMTFITTLKDEDYVVYRETDITEKRTLEHKIARALESLGVGQEPRTPDPEGSDPRTR